MSKFLKRPVVVTTLAIVLGVLAWQTESMLAILGVGTAAWAGWSVVKGTPLAQAITVPAAAWAGSYGLYDAAESGAGIGGTIAAGMGNVAIALYLVWLIPTVLRHGLTWESATKAAIGFVVVSMVWALLSNIA